MEFKLHHVLWIVQEVNHILLSKSSFHQFSNFALSKSLTDNSSVSHTAHESVQIQISSSTQMDKLKFCPLGGNSLHQ